MADAIPVPFDVRLMNIIATLMFALVAVMLLAAGAW
ncbi:MAG: cell division protein FtsQ, partial [Comamonadaceae bacterium]